MDAYKTPAADLNASIKIFSPVKAIVYGLCISIILASIASIIESIAFGFALGLDFTDESAFESALADSIVFMTFDIAMSALICFFAGKTVGKRVQGQEAKYGAIVSLLTISIYLPLFIISDAFTIWPIWYNFFSFAVVLSAIYFGAKSAAKA